MDATLQTINLQLPSSDMQFLLKEWDGLLTK